MRFPLPPSVYPLAVTAEAPRQSLAAIRSPRPYHLPLYPYTSRRHAPGGTDVHGALASHPPRSLAVRSWSEARPAADQKGTVIILSVAET